MLRGGQHNFTRSFSRTAGTFNMHRAIASRRNYDPARTPAYSLMQAVSPSFCSIQYTTHIYVSSTHVTDIFARTTPTVQLNRICKVICPHISISMSSSPANPSIQFIHIGPFIHVRILHFGLLPAQFKPTFSQYFTCEPSQYSVGCVSRTHIRSILFRLLDDHRVRTV